MDMVICSNTSIDTLLKKELGHYVKKEQVKSITVMHNEPLERHFYRVTFKMIQVSLIRDVATMMRNLSGVLYTTIEQKNEILQYTR